MLLETIHKNHPSEELDRARNPEHYLYIMAKVLGIPSEVVPQDWLPNFLSVHVRSEVGPVFCLRGLSRQLLLEPLGPWVTMAAVPYQSCDAVESNMRQTLALAEHE